MIKKGKGGILTEKSNKKKDSGKSEKFEREIINQQQIPEESRKKGKKK
jgi:hypothetical protein